MSVGMTGDSKFIRLQLAIKKCSVILPSLANVYLILISMAAVVAHIVHPVDIHRRLMDMEQARGVQMMRFTLLMERNEGWAIDDIRTDVNGVPVAITDERGTAEERMRAVVMFEDLLNSAGFATYLKNNEDDTQFSHADERLVEVLAMLRTGRFVVCLNYMSTLSGAFVANWLQKVDQRADMGNVLAHVLRERLLMIRRANLVRAVFSREAVAQVSKILEGIQG